ncbi:hypothetical protein RJ495_000723 [Pluralibacter gergoviae]|nr:hypothetical protein [Pluralibacter gergoviae]
MANKKDDGTRYQWQEIADRFGVEHSTVSRIWKGKGLDISWPKPLVDDWLLTNIIRPLQQGDTKEHINRATLRKLQAEADLKELELKQLSGQLISTEILSVLLSEHFANWRKIMRSIPATTYIELAELSDEPLDIKAKLQEVIDAALHEIGKLEYERQGEDIEDTQSNDTEHTTTEEDDSE